MDVMEQVTTPTCDVDFYDDAVIADPYPHYRALRDLGPAVWLARNRCWAITRYSDVRAALRDDALFISGEGVMMNDPVNINGRDNILCMDGEEHHRHRRIVARPLMPGGIDTLRAEIRELAEARVAELVARGSFDGVGDFAHYLPLVVVSRMVGLPEEGREQMLEWANHIFNTMGPVNARFETAVESANKALAFVAGVDPARMRPDSWGARLFDLATQGEISDAEARGMMFAYVAPALDTTINATSSALWLLGQHPDQWDMIRDNPALVAPAIEEALRLEAPIRAFSRVVSRDHAMGDATLRAGDRVLIVYASANRDERYWPDAERFDIRRKAPQEQMSFGTGVHMCVGMHLARLEMRCLFDALARRVARFVVSEPKRELHNVLRGLSGFRVTVTQAG